jgi:6,7-dimethyl-8-ribityllumazine synthase
MAIKKIQERSFDDPIGWVAIIASEWNREITEGLLKGVETEFKKYPHIAWEVRWVPGAFEIPLKAQMTAREVFKPDVDVSDDQKEKRFFNVIIALGCVLRGDTYHFEMVANECARGCMDVMLRENIPVVFEVLACDSLKDAKKRSSGKKNSGTMAAHVALDWLEIK